MLNVESVQHVPFRNQRWAPDETTVRSILASAVRAPSADNSQPWQIDLDGGAVVVALDETRSSCAGIGNLASLLSLGALLESIVLETEGRGWEARVTRHARAFRVDFRPCEAEWASYSHLELASALGRRATDRAPYELTPLAPSEIHALEHEGRAGAEVRVTSRRDAIERAAHAHAIAERVRFDAIDPRALHKWLRFDPQSASTTKDGLDVRLLEVRAHERVFLMASGLRGFVECMRPLGAGKLAAMRARSEVLASGGVGVIVQRGVAEDAFVHSGRVMMRAWLRATSLGLSFAPVMASALLPLGRAMGLLPYAGAGEPRLAEAERTLRETFDVPSDSRVAFVFRVGIPTRAPTIASERRDLESFATAESASERGDS